MNETPHPLRRKRRRLPKTVRGSLAEEYRIALDLEKYLSDFLDDCEASPTDGPVLIGDIWRVVISRAFLLRVFHDFQSVVQDEA